MLETVKEYIDDNNILTFYSYCQNAICSIQDAIIDREYSINNSYDLFSIMKIINSASEELGKIDKF